jgi:hypothetical protein
MRFFQHLQSRLVDTANFRWFSTKFQKEPKSMSEKVVVPKFEIPSETTHPAIKIVAAIGVALLATTAILGIAIMNRRSEQAAAVAKRDAIIAARIAEQKAAEEKAKAEAAAALAAKEAAKKAEEAKIAAAKAAAAAEKQKLAEAEKAPAGKHHHHHGKAGAKGAGAAVASKAGDDKKSAPKSTRDNAAIDKLLASFK